jgi:D-alanyl-D-alanine carboxypeptidase
MDRVVNLAFLIALAVLVALPIGGCFESSPSEVPPSAFIGQTLHQVVTHHGAIVMVGFGEVISTIMDEARYKISQLRVDLKAKDRGDEGGRLRDPGDGQSLDVQEHLDQYLAGIEEQIQGQSSLQVLLYSEKLGVSYEYPPGGKDVSFHTASIGKVFTAALICMLAERGAISLDDPIVNYLPEPSSECLFVFEGKDYAEQVTIRELLTHTSGVADYVEDPVINGAPFLELVLNNRDTYWTPEMLLAFSRDNQHAVGRPGDVFHYSDTGYVLLGRIIENATSKPFHVNLHDEFFTPLEMNDSYLMFRSEPANQPKKPVQKTWLNDTEISQFTSLSSDWAGGGIVSTPADLLRFHMALRDGQLISPDLLGQMEAATNQFMPGINYGMGMMEVDFQGLSPMLSGLPPVTGHVGIWGTHMFYDRTTDTYIIINLGSSSCMNTSFEVLIELMSTIRSVGN